MTSTSNSNPIQSDALETLNTVTIESQGLLDIGQPSQQGQSVPIPSLLGLDMPTSSISDYNASVIPLDPFSSQSSLWSEAGNAVEGSAWTSSTDHDSLLGVDIAPKQIVFVDGSVADSDQILSDLTFDAEIVRLDSTLDGITQISQVLAQRQNVAGIHIVTHGSEGSLQLGATTLNGETLATYQAALQGWATSLTEQADILIYGCDVAGNAEGKAFVDQMSQWTGADVAASDDLTGHVMLGGDWQLEYNTGRIEASSLSSTGYQGVLAHVVLSDSGKLTYSSSSERIHDLKFSIANGSLTIKDEIYSSDGTTEIRAGNGVSQGNDKNKVSVAVSSITAIEINTGRSTDTFTFGTGFNNFSNAVDISINAGGGADTIKLENAFNTKGGSFSIRGQDGDRDEIILSATLQTQSGDLDFRADTIKADANSRLVTQGGNIEFQGDNIRVNDNAVLSTRSISGTSDEDADSTGHSGDISLIGQRISIGTDGSDSTAKLLAHVEDDSSYSAGDITIKASDEEYIANVIDGLETSFSKVDLFGATVKGNDVTIKATSKYDNTFDDGGSVKDVFLSIAAFVDNFSIFGGAAIAKSEAFVTIDDGSNITAGSLETSATATTDAAIKPLLSWLVGAAYAKADSTAVVSVGGTITTTGDVEISTETDSMVDAQVSTSAPPTTGKSDNPVNSAAAFTLSELKSNSTAEVTETATITAGGDVDVTAKTIDRNVTSATSGLNPSGTAALAVALSFEDGKTRALVDGAVTATGDITVDAQQQKRNTKGLLNGGNALLSGSGVTASAGLSSTKSSAPSSIIGSVSKAFSDGFIAIAKKLIPTDDTETSDKASKPSQSISVPAKVGAAIAYVDDKNDVVARIGRNATGSTDPTVVQSTGGSISIDSTVESRPDVSSISKIEDAEKEDEDSSSTTSESGDQSSQSSDEEETQFSGSAGFALGNYTNKAEAYINDFAEVDAQQDLSITSQTLNDYTWQWGVDLAEPFTEADNILEGLEAVGRGGLTLMTSYFNDNLGLNNYVFDSWSQAYANNGSTAAVAGSATVLEMNQTSKAFIGESAKVNQDADLRSDSQAVVVDAKNINESVHFGGNIQLPGVSWSKGYAVTPSLTAGYGTEGDGAVGGAVLVLDYINHTSAKVKEEAQIYADSLAVTADSKTMNVTVGGAGGKAETFGFSGVGNWVSVDNTTTANIAGGSTVVVGDNDVDGASSKSLVVEATDTTDSINILGGVTSSQSVGVGATIGFNTINRNTRAVIGNLTDADGSDKTSLTSSGDIKVRADNHGSMGSFSLAAAAAAPDAKKDEDDADSSSSNKTFGVGISGDASVNEISDITEAYMRHVNLTLDEEAEVDVTAQNSSNILAIGGAAALSMGDATQETKTTVGVAGSYGQNTVQQETKAYLQTVTQQSDSETLSDVAVEAENRSEIISVNAGLSGAVGATTSELNIAVAGAVTVNEVDNKTKAYIRGSSLTDLTSTSIEALDNTQIHGNAGGAALAFAAGTTNSNTSASVGVGLAINDVTNDISAFVEKSTLTAGGNVSVNAESKSTVEAFALGAAASVSSSASANGISLSGAGAGAKNEINNTIQAYLSDSSTITTTDSGTLDITATDESNIMADSGGFSLAFASGNNAVAASVGASVAENEIHNTIKADVEDSEVTAAGAVTIAADSKATIDALSISGSLAVASGTSNGIAIAGAGAGTANRIDNDIKARVKDSTVTMNNAATLDVTAKDQSKIKADAGGVAIAAGAVGASIASNQIGKNQGHSIQAIINDSTVTDAGDVTVHAESESTIDALALGAAVGVSGSTSGPSVSLAGAGAGTENDIKTAVRAYLGNNSTVTTTGTAALAVTATDDSKIKADSGGFSVTLAGASNSAATASVGASVAENTIRNTVDADVEDATVTTGGAVTVTADSTATIDALSMGGAASGSAGSSGSLALSGAGAGTTNQIDNEIKARLKDSTIETSNAANVEVKATDQSTITADAGGVAIAAALAGDAGVGLSVGASIASNQIGKNQGHSIQAIINDSTVTAAGDVNLSATSDAAIEGLAFAGAGALGASANGAGLAFAGAGTGIENDIQATIAAVIKDGSDVTATGDVTIEAEDTSQITADAGAGASALGGGQGGIAASVGVAIADNTISNTIQAYIQDSSVDANALTLDANSDSTINTFGLAGAIALSAGASGALSLAGSGTAANNTLENTIQAFIFDGSTITTDADLNQTATDQSTIKSIAVGGSIALAGGGFSGAIAIGAVTVENTISNTVQSFIGDLSDDSTEVTVGGDLNLLAQSQLTLTENTAVAASFSGSGGQGFAFSGAGAAVITETTNVVEAFISNLDTTSGSDRNINVTDNLSLQAIDTPTVQASVGSGAAVAGLVGASVGVSTTETTIDNQVRAYIDNSRVEATGNVDVAVSSTPNVDVLSIATSVAASIGGAGAGAEALGTVKSTVEARIGNDSNVTGSDITVAAESDDHVKAAAYGSGAGLVATGASVAQAKANSNTQSHVSNASVTATNLDITAKTTGDVEADATAAGGAAVVATASSSDAVNNSTVKATVGSGSVLDITETLTVQAESDSEQDAKADGYNGGLLAAGANMATASSDLTTEVVLETGVNITAADLTIQAKGKDDNFANSIAGGGGLVSAQAATTVTDSKSSASVRIEDGDSTEDNVEIDVTGALEITADQTTHFNGKADSINASVVGGSGASVTNTVDTDATVEIGVDTDSTQQDLVIEAGSLTVNATQTILKAELNDQTAEAGSGGAIDGSAVVSKTIIENRTDITIGDNSTSNGFGTEISTTGDMVLNALNDVSAWDETKLDSGGLISAAIAESKLLHRVNDATVTIQDADLESGQAITLSALANVDLDTTANASSYGLAGLPMGISKATSDTRNQIQLMDGAYLRTEGDVNLLAGQAADGSTNQMDVNARSNIWNNTAAPLAEPGSSEASIKLENTIHVADGAEVESVRDANLIAVDGIVATEAVRKGQDLYSKTAGAVTGASTANIKTKRDDITSNSGVTVNGSVAVSIDNKETLTIAEAIGLTSPTMVDGVPVYPITITEQSDGVGDLTLTVENLSNKIQTELTRLRSLKANHAGNVAAVASYTAEINFWEQQLTDLGDVSQAIYINVPDITVKTGDIRVIGDYLQGSGDLNSPGDAEITITNNSPYYLRLNNLEVPEVQGGRILFNSALVTDNDSISDRNTGHYQANFGSVITAENSDEAVIEVENTYDPTFAEQASAFATQGLSTPGAPDIEVVGSVDNFKGTVRLANNEGSVLVDGSLNAKTVEINSGSDFVLSDEDEEGFFHVGGDPRSKLAGVATTSETGTATSRTVSTATSSTSSITASNNVFISARYLNVNGLIQSGTPDRDLTLGSNLNADISAFKTAYDSDPTGGKYYTLSTDEGTSIEARYNAETNRIEVDNVEIQGGYMQLVGNIISTGNGKLEVLDGFGQIGITNSTGYELEINRLDTGGDGIEGQLQIIDTARRGADNQALITTYTRIGDDITRTNTSGNTTILSNTRTASYAPRANQRYTWVTGQAFITETVKLYKDKSQFGIDGLIDDSKLEKETVTFLDEVPLLEGAFVETRNSAAAYDYSRETVTLEEEERVSREKWKETKGFLNTKTVYYQEDTYQTGEKTFNTHSYQADSQINIEFIGYDTGSVVINSGRNVFLVDSIENQGGTTTINNHNGKLTHLSTIGAVVSDRLIINTHTLTDLRTDVNELQFATKGKAIITDIQGDVTISGASASYFSPVEISVEGSLLGSSSGEYDLRGSQVSITSRNGSIGSADQALRVNSALTNHTTWSPEGFNGWAGLKLDAAQNINVNETEGDLYLVSAQAGGDVTLGALAGSVFDNNNAETVDPYSQQQLNELWASMNLTTDRSAEAIAGFKQQATQLYETYWNYRNPATTTNRDRSVTYIADAYDPSFTYQYSDTARTELLDTGYGEASITQLEAEKTHEYHTLHTLFSGGSVDLSAGQAHLATVIEDIFRDSDFSGKDLTDPSTYSPELIEEQYQVSAQQQSALRQGSQWTQAELKNTMRSGTFGSIADTQYTVENANITAGGNVTVTASEGIGHTAGTLVIENWGSKQWSDLSNQEQLALSYAERDDLTYFDAAGDVIENPEQSSDAIASIHISLKQDLDIDAEGDINLTASQHIFLGSEQDINLDQVQAGSTVRIKAAEGVYDVATTNTVNITGADLVLEAGNASIGSRDAAITIDLDNSQDAGLTARAEDTIHIDNAEGTLNIEGVYSGEGAVFSSTGDLEVDANHLAGGSVALRGDGGDNRIDIITDDAELPVDLIIDGGAGQDHVVVTPTGEETATDWSEPESELASESEIEAIAHWSLSETTGTAAVNEGSLGAAVVATYVGNPSLDVEGLVADSDGAVYFDGIDDGVNLTNHADINVGSHAQRSVELWFKAEDLEGRQVIYEEGGTINGINLYLDGDRLNFGIWAGGNRKWLDHTVESDTIYHAVLVFDQGQLTAYLNGQSIGQVATGFSVLPSHGGLVGIARTNQNTRFADNTIGSHNTDHFHGTIDDFSLYNDPLSADAIAQRYSVGQQPQQPIAHWSLSETTGTETTNEGTLGRAVRGYLVGIPNLDAEGLVANSDGAVHFDGIDDGINLSSHADINLASHAQRSVELWFKANDLDGKQVIYEEGGGSNGISLNLDGDLLNFGIWAGGKRKWLDHTVEANTTYHAVLVFDQGQLTAYVNGESIGQVATGFSVLPAHGDGIGIGKANSGTLFADNTFARNANHFHGTVDDLSLYNDQLSADAIAERYAVNLQATAHWSLSEITGTSAVNEGTLGSDVRGTYVGNPNLDAEGLVADSDGAVYFDGINDGVNLTNHAAINTSSHAQRSIELWFKAEDLDGRQVIYEEGGTYNGVNLYLDGDRLNFGIWANNNGQWLDHSVEANTTYHAVLVFDQGQLTAYINGQSIGQVATSFSVLPPHGGAVGIAKVHQHTRFADNVTTANHANYFHGTIDDFSLYNDALSADAIAQRYEHQALEETPSDITSDIPISITGHTLQNIQYRNLEHLDGSPLTTASTTMLVENGNATITVLSPGNAAQITHINNQDVSTDATVTLASGAEVTVNANGTLAYDTAGRFSSLSEGDIGNDFFTYTTLENGVSNTATIRLDVSGINSAPVANADQATTLENGTVTFSALRNDTDIDLNDILSITQVNGQGIAAGATKVLASGATVTLNNDGTFTYAPNGQFEDLPTGQTAQDSFSYTLSDGKGGTETATVTLTIQGQDDALIAVTDIINVSENGQQTINVLGNDQGIELDETVTFTDVNGQQFSIGSTLTLDSGAKLTLNADGSFTYNPNGKFAYLSAGQTVQESFTYTISDGQGDISTATVTLTVNGANNAPIARGNGGTISEEDLAETLWVLDNDSDVDRGDTFQITQIGDTTINRMGWATLESGARVRVFPGGLSYYPNGAFSHLDNGEEQFDRFTYTITDSQGGTATATVTMKIVGVGGGLVARGGDNNPFNAIDLGTHALYGTNNTAPAFMDIDGDNDLDIVVTEGDGTIHYYRNDNGVSHDRFTHVTGNANPFNGVKTLGGVAPSFADIDGDGDLDAFVPGTKATTGPSAGQSSMRYLRNDNGSFTNVTGNANPLNGVAATAAPEFVDIDGDGDLDAFMTDRGQINFYRNNGGQLTKDVGNNPFASYQTTDLSNHSESIRFADLDRDGDLDGFLLTTSQVEGNERSEVIYFENENGNFSAAKSQSDANNPFNNVGDTVGNHLRGLTFVDLDRDGDLDAAFGGNNGKLHYFKNMT